MPFALVAATAAIVATVTGVPSSRGSVHVDACAQAHWLGPDCEYSGDAPAQQGTTVVTIRDVPPGRYGLQAFHDANSNGKADRNFLGMPTERVGFSNNALKGLSKPKFDDAAITHGDTPQSVTFRLRTVP